MSRLGKPVQFSNGGNREPVSDVYGLDRGKPIDRHYIETFVSKHADSIRGTVLEIGEKKYSLEYGSPSSERRALSIGLAKDVDISVDLANPAHEATVPADCFICTQTLNFIFALPETVRGLRRWIKPGGKLICTVGGISAVSAYDAERWGHYWGFTPQSLSALFSPHEWADIRIETYGNYFAAQSFLAGLACEDLPNPEWLGPSDSRYPIVIGMSATRI